MELKIDCKYFRGDVPCLPHKQLGVHCESCGEYKKISRRILIIKLGAAGDVIRTTPLLEKIFSVYPDSHITWLTDFPDLVPISVDNIISYKIKDIQWLESRTFDIVYSLDKDKEAISLAEKIEAKEKFGFGIDDYGRARPFNDYAKHKLLTGIFDDISKKNTKSYPQEIFEICGFNFSHEEYQLNLNSKKTWSIDRSKKIIGLNTGCGGRWSSRLWKDENWMELAKLILESGNNVLWLGGEQEHSKNLMFHEKVGGYYFGHYSFDDFIALINHTDLVVTQVTMALHLAIGLKKQVVLMNNIFNKNEFDLYGRGVIIEPSEPCDCYYTPVCPHDSMSKILPKRVFDAIQSQMGF